MAYGTKEYFTTFRGLHITVSYKSGSRRYLLLVIVLQCVEDITHLSEPVLRATWISALVIVLLHLLYGETELSSDILHCLVNWMQ